jgi:hypothetical protein
MTNAIAKPVDKETIKRPFPCKVYQMLEDADEQGFRHVVSWNSDGSGFKVHDSAVFTKLIIPLYFNQTKYKSFQRQLCLYGFDRIASGKQKGCRFHKNFVRGSRTLCKMITYIGIKSKALHRGGEGASEKPKEGHVASTPRRVFMTVDARPLHSTQPMLLPKTGNDRLNSSKPKRIISPSISPVSSEIDLTALTKKTTENIGYFEGMSFFIIGSGDMPGIEKPNQTENTLKRQVSDHTLASASTRAKELKQAWEKGFELALSIPPESCFSIMAENEACYTILGI